MKKIFTLSTCSTSKKMLKESGILEQGFLIKDIKTDAISPSELDEMRALAGSYDALFSRRAQKYKSLGLKNIKLTEAQIRDLIIEEYTFLKRPVIIDGSKYFIGNSKNTQSELFRYIAAKNTQ